MADEVELTVTMRRINKDDLRGEATEAGGQLEDLRQYMRDHLIAGAVLMGKNLHEAGVDITDLLYEYEDVAGRSYVLANAVGGGVMKKAKTTKDAWEIQDTKKGEPHGWIQWKGTDVCMDIYCECGCHSHIDAMFAYHVKCPSCGRVYCCNGHIEFIELEQEPETCTVVGDDDDIMERE